MSVHVYPLDDLVDHEVDGEPCVCGPTFQRITSPNGGEWMVTHHALDGRE